MPTADREADADRPGSRSPESGASPSSASASRGRDPAAADRTAPPHASDREGAPRPERIFLIGYRATGKSSLGRLLARRLGYDFADTDARVEERAGMSIAQFFRTFGEAAFRERESEELQRLVAADRSGKGVVIATGGGIVLSGANVALMRRTGFVVWLTASVERIRRRLSADDATPSRRPALSGASATDEVESVLRARLPLYRAAAHLSISTESGDETSLVAELLERLGGSM